MNVSPSRCWKVRVKRSRWTVQLIGLVRPPRAGVDAEDAIEDEVVGRMTTDSKVLHSVTLQLGDDDLILSFSGLEDVRECGARPFSWPALCTQHAANSASRGQSAVTCLFLRQACSCLDPLCLVTHSTLRILIFQSFLHSLLLLKKSTLHSLSTAAIPPSAITSSSSLPHLARSDLRFQYLRSSAHTPESERPCRSRSVRQRRATIGREVQPGRSASRSVLIRLASSRPRPIRPQPHPQAPHAQLPKLPLQFQDSQRLALRPFPPVSSSNLSFRLALFKFKASCGPSSRQSQQPPPEHGSFSLDMRDDVQPLIISSVFPPGSALRRLQSCEVAQHRLAPGRTSGSVSRVMASFEPPFGARSSLSAHRILNDDGSKHTFGTLSALG